MSKRVKPVVETEPEISGESPVFFCKECGSTWLKERGPLCIECETQKNLAK